MYSRHATSLLDLLERAWAHRLRRVSLAVEIGAEETMVASAAGALGEVYRGLRRGGHLELARRWPACVVVALSGVASAGYRSGSCWPAWWAATRYRGGTADATAFGESFQAALDLLRLPGLPGSANRHLGPILMHAGVPTSCLAGFFRFLLTGRSDDLDEPVRRFLEHGGDCAADLSERCLDLLDRLRAAEPDLAGLALPARVVDHARILVRDGLLDVIPAEERPELRLGRHVQLRVPVEGIVTLRDVAGSATVEDVAGSATVDDETIQVRPGDLVPLTRPVREIRVSWRAGTREIRLDLSDPLLVFTEDGRHLPPGRSLPADAVWAAFPKDRDLVADEPLRVIVESVGWPGWRLAQVAPGQATWIALDGGPRRPVRGRDRPRVRTSTPIAGVTTPEGAPVVGGFSVWLPGGGLTWSVEVRHAGRSVFRDTVTPAEPVELTDLWSGVGEITVTVRGPIGYGARRTIMVAAGLAVRYEPGLRLLTPDGLQTATAHVDGIAPLIFRPAETARTFDYGGVPLVVTPPHTRIATDRHEWRAAPLRLAVEELDSIDWLRIDGPEPGPIQVRAGGQAVQELAPSARGLYRPRRVLDTVTACRGADLVLPPDMPVARIRPAGTVSGADHRGDRLVLLDLMWLDGLVAELRPDHGAAEVVPVPRDGVIPLPPRLAGSLRVRLAVPDPWTGPNWPSDALICEKSG